MILKTQSGPLRLAAANALRLRRWGRTADWVLSVVFAGLLGTAVWKLEHGSPGPVIDGSLRPAATTVWSERAGAVARAMLETLIVRDTAQGGLSAGQIQPEGWPLWNGEPAFRSASSGCRGDAPPSGAAARCD